MNIPKITKLVIASFIGTVTLRNVLPSQEVYYGSNKRSQILTIDSHNYYIFDRHKICYAQPHPNCKNYYFLSKTKIII